MLDPRRPFEVTPQPPLSGCSGRMEYQSLQLPSSRSHHCLWAAPFAQALSAAVTLPTLPSPPPSTWSQGAQLSHITRLENEFREVKRPAPCHLASDRRGKDWASEAEEGSCVLAPRLGPSV